MRLTWTAALMIAVAGCGAVWNDPYPAADRGKSILYSAFVQRPKHLDPVQSYTEDEARFTQQIYEPPLQYHYLKQPYTLVPLTTNGMPSVRLLDASGKGSDAADGSVAASVYEIRIRPGIHYQ
ncbi:MAG: peptide ABC transporter substrate-binding protein, partial [Nitrospirota bacterium]|nr:peptide ABC transporter substrate-binding protein [Nitrospirota bacterium]